MGWWKKLSEAIKWWLLNLSFSFRQLHQETLVSATDSAMGLRCWARGAGDFPHCGSSARCRSHVMLGRKPSCIVPPQSREVYLFFILRYFSCFYFFLYCFLASYGVLFQALLERGEHSVMNSSAHKGQKTVFPFLRGSDSFSATSV